MGKDKFENEKLIEHGWPEDVWFHVDDLSSAHVYLRLPRGPMRRQFLETGKWREPRLLVGHHAGTAALTGALAGANCSRRGRPLYAGAFAAKRTGRLDHIPEALEDCCELVKSNSIEGSKKSTVHVVYTEWENLRKTAGMADGQVGFHDQKKVVQVKEVPKNKDVVRRLEKTRREEFPDLAKQRAERDRELVNLKKNQAKEQARIERETAERQKAEKDARDYKHLFAAADSDSRLTNDKVQSSSDTSAAVSFEEDFM